MDMTDRMFYGATSTLVIVLVVLFWTGRLGSNRIPVSPLGNFCFGDGWWVAWNFLLYASILGIGIGLIMARTIDANEEFIAFMILLVSFGLLLLITLINAVLWSTTVYDGWASKYLVAPALVITGWFAVLVLLLVYHQVLIYFAFGRITEIIATAAFVIGITVLNLFAIHRYRAGRIAQHTRRSGFKG